MCTLRGNLDLWNLIMHFWDYFSVHFVLLTFCCKKIAQILTQDRKKCIFRYHMQDFLLLVLVVHHIMTNCTKKSRKHFIPLRSLDYGLPLQCAQAEEHTAKSSITLNFFKSSPETSSRLSASVPRLQRRLRHKPNIPGQRCLQRIAHSLSPRITRKTAKATTYIIPAYFWCTSKVRLDFVRLK